MGNWGWKKGFQKFKFSHELVFELSNSKLFTQGGQ